MRVRVTVLAGKREQQRQEAAARRKRFCRCVRVVCGQQPGNRRVVLVPADKIGLSV